MNPVFQWVYAQPPQRTATSTTNKAGITDRIQQAFDAASDTTGTSFQYLLDTARRESSLDTNAKAQTSSATGLFQFVESTWLETMKEAGPDLGLSQYADQISVDSRGRYTVADASARADILALRSDPEVASMLAGAYTRQNADYLSGKLGREVTSGELYIAHFLGAKGAANLISAAVSTPDQSAAALFPKQAQANRSIFYSNGQPRSVAEVYATLTSQHGNDAPLTPGSDRVMTAFQSLEDGAGQSDSALGFAVDGSGATTDPGWRAADSSDAFSNLFRNSTSKNPMAAAAFWRGFSQAPALFDVALSEDAATLATARDASADASAALRASVVHPGQIAGRAFETGTGPLDLAQFLKES